VEGSKIQKGLNQYWTVLTWAFDSQTSSHNENRPISHFVITNLKIGLMVLTHVRSGLLKIDFFFNNRIGSIHERTKIQFSSSQGNN
jgi:hypothetical protein